MALSGHGRPAMRPRHPRRRARSRSHADRVTLAPPGATADRRDSRRHRLHRWRYRGCLAAAARRSVAAPDGPTAAATQTARRSWPSTVTFFGRGYGHGVGMSQYGARGRALAGQDAATILAHYYHGRTLGSIDPATPIRVRVLVRKWTAAAAAPLMIYGRRHRLGRSTASPRPSPPTLACGSSRRAVTATAGHGGRVVDGGPRPDGEVLLDRRPRPTSTVRGVDRQVPPPTLLEAGSIRPLSRDPAGPHGPVERQVSGRQRGRRGAVPAGRGPGRDAARAGRPRPCGPRRSRRVRMRLAGSARASPTSTSRRHASQVYLGARARSARPTPRSRTRPASSCWSGTADREHALPLDRRRRDREQRERLHVGERQAGRRAGQLPARLARPRAGRHAVRRRRAVRDVATKTYARAELSAWFAADPRTNVGTLKALDLRDRGVSGRLISVTLIGSAGTKTVSGEVFRAVFNAARPAGDPMLRSTLFDTGADPLTRPSLDVDRDRAARGPVPTGPRPTRDGRLPRRRVGHSRPRRRRAVRATRARVVPGRPVVVDDPAQARGLPGGVPRVRSARRGRVRRCRPCPPDGRRRDRPQPRQDRCHGRQRRSRSWRRRDLRLVRCATWRDGPAAAARGCPATPRPGEIPATTPASDALSADLRRRGFRFVGSTIVYAFMQSVGLVDDHLAGLLPLPRATASAERLEIAALEPPRAPGSRGPARPRPRDQATKTSGGGVGRVERVRVEPAGCPARGDAARRAGAPARRRRPATGRRSGRASGSPRPRRPSDVDAERRRHAGHDPGHPAQAEGDDRDRARRRSTAGPTRARGSGSGARRAWAARNATASNGSGGP